MGVYRHHLFNLNVQRLRQMFHGKIKKKRNETKRKENFKSNFKCNLS